MKRILSILLVVMLVVGAVYSPLSVSASDAEYTLGNELVSNGDFENLTLNPVGKNVTGIMGNTNANVLNNGAWLRATGGLSYADYGDLSAYNAETDTITKATTTEYPLYFAPCSTIIAQPDKQTNHIGRAQQTLLQAVNVSDGTYRFKFKARTTADTNFFTVSLRGLQQSSGKITDSFYTKYNIEIVEKSGDFTVYNGVTDKVQIYLTNKTEWTDVEFTANITKIENPVVTNKQEIFETDFTMLCFYHDAVNLSSGEIGSKYRKTGIFLDDVSVKSVSYITNIIAPAEFYDAKGNKVVDSNETANISSIVANGKITATASNIPENGLTFIGWYKNGVKYSDNNAITVDIGNDTYTPHFKSANLLATSASFEQIANGTVMRYIEYHPADGKTPNYPEGNLWGISAVNGYLTYESAEKLTSHRVATYDEDIYAVDGTKAHQTYSYRNVGNWTSYTNGVTVVSGDAHTGNNALQIMNADMSYAMGIDVTPNSNYTLTYYVKDATAGVTSTSGYGSAILSSINISAGVHSSGGGEVAIAANLPEHIFGSTIQAVSPYTFCYSKMKDVPDTWTKVEHKFNSGSHEKVYFLVGNRNSRNTKVLLDDIVLIKEAKEVSVTASATVTFVDKSGNTITNSNSYADTTITANEDETNTLTVNYSKDTSAYTFLGWYDSKGNLVSTSETYEGAPAGTYVAKIKDSNIYTAASYEGYANGTSLSHTDKNTPFPINGQWGGFAWDGYRKQTVEGTIYDNQGNAYTQTASGSYSNGVTATVSNAYAHSGKNSLLLKGTYWTMVGGINNVKPGKTYEFSMWIKNDPTKTEAKQIKGAAILTTVNIGQKATVFPTHITEKYSTLGLVWDNGKYVQSNIPLSENGWTKLSTRFTIPEKATELDTVYISLDASGSDTTNASQLYIDDISVSEVFDGVKTAYNSAAALRTAETSSTGKNGMRIYNKIEKEFISDYGIKEYGSIAILDSKLKDDFTIETENVVRGIAYNAETQPDAILIDQTSTANIYTAYLSNIPTKRYDEKYTIRAYAIDNSGYVYYGESISVSVYDVALAMDNGNAVTVQTNDDIAAFNIFAGGKDGKFTMYDNWLKTSKLKFAGKLRNIAKAEDTLSGAELTKALEVDGYYEPFFERSIANVGNRAMLKAMFEKAERGEDITVVGFGGSITQKAACSSELDSYSHLVAVWLREQFPNITVNWYNAGIGSTTSVLGIARLQDHVLSYNPDLVILDFTTNDQTNDYHAGSYEAILRTLYEKEIAVVTIAFGNIDNKIYDKGNGKYFRGSNREDLHGPVMLYNDVPVIDYYGVMWDCYLDADGDGFNVDSDAAHWKTLWADYIHPTPIGHKLAANAINYYLGKVYDDLDNIIEKVTYPSVPYDKHTSSFMGSMMYGEANVGSLLTDSSNVTTGSYNNYDSTTVTNWTIWKIAEGGYIEFTIDKCKLFALMSINGPEAPVAEIYINDEKVATHNATRTEGELNWMNFIKFYDGKDTVKVKIKSTKGTYRITAALISKD